MSVKVRIPPFLRKLTNHQAVVEVPASSVSECLDKLGVRFPGIKQRLCNERGELFTYIDIYVSGHSAYPEELAKPLKDGNEVIIVPVIDGG